MNNKKKYSVSVSSEELASALGLSKEDAVAFEFRALLNKKIVDLVKRKKLTHAEVAKKAKASRTRITAILSGKTQGVSTDFLLRILQALGCSTRPQFLIIKVAA